MKYMGGCKATKSRWGDYSLECGFDVHERIVSLMGVQLTLMLDRKHMYHHSVFRVPCWNCHGRGYFDYMYLPSMEAKVLMSEGSIEDTFIKPEQRKKPCGVCLGVTTLNRPYMNAQRR